ncbi:MAG: cytochrome P450 [Myxococcota bacterium]
MHPDVAVVSLFLPETLAEPWAAYRTLRDHAPVYEVPGLGIKVVTRYDLVAEVIRDTETYSSGFGDFLGSGSASMLPPEARDRIGEIRRGMLPLVDTLISADPPLHTRYRGLVKRVFTSGRVRAMEPETDRIIAETIDTFIETDGPVDFMQAFAFPVPLRIIADRLGIPEADRDFFYEGATVAASTLRMSTVSAEEAIRRAEVEADLQRYMVDLVESRRSDPREDMATVLAEARLDDERPLDPAEIWSILNQFLVAGHETTTSTFGAGMQLLCQQPGLEASVRGEEERIRAFCEETLRLEAPVQGLPRRVTRDTVLGETSLVEGDLIMLRFGAANRDERQFPAPDTVDLFRKNPGAHFSFGSGTHHCLGAPLARQELNRGFKALLDRMGGFRMAEGKPAPVVEPSLILRGLEHLWIEFDRR